MVSPVRGNLLRLRRVCGCFDVLHRQQPFLAPAVCYEPVTQKEESSTGGVTYPRSLKVTKVSCVPGAHSLGHVSCTSEAPKTVQSIARCREPERLSRRLHKFRQNAPEIARVEERDRRAHRPVPRPRVDQPDARRADLRQRRAHVRDRVPDVVHPLAAPLKELPDRGVGRERLKQLHVGRARRVASIASLTPCSVLVSWLTTVSPNTLTYRSMAASRFRQAIPT